MAIFRLQLFLPPLGYCPSSSAINLCFFNTTHSHDNGHSLSSTIAISRLNYKVPRPLSVRCIYFNAHSYCQKSLKTFQDHPSHNKQLPHPRQLHFTNHLLILPTFPSSESPNHSTLNSFSNSASTLLGAVYC